MDFMRVRLAADILPMRADELLSVTDICSKGEFRRCVQQGSLTFNDTKLTDIKHVITIDDFLEHQVLVIKNGRRSVWAICAIMTLAQIEETKQLARVAQPGSELRRSNP